MFDLIDPYDSGMAPAIRIVNGLNHFWDFLALEWVDVANANTKIAYTEFLHGDGSSRYRVDFTLPAGGPFVQEAFLPSGEVIAAGSTAVLIQVSSRLEQAPATIIIPSPPTPNQQTLYGYAKEFAADTWSVGDVATMTITPNQGVNGVILEPVVRTSTVDANGLFIFHPDKGAAVKVTLKAAGGRAYLNQDLVVSEADTANILNY